MKISVVICTHNPRQSHLAATIDGLQAQLLPKQDWELLVVDNGSEKPVGDDVDLSWHPLSRIICESNLGVVHARRTGIVKSSADLIVFVDDDNVLAPDYLTCCLEVACEFPKIAVFGGQIDGQLELQPSPAIVPYLGLLAIRQFSRDAWSNDPHDRTNPAGAGMCVRRSAAFHWLDVIEQRELTIGLMIGSVGRNMMRGEDDDLCYAARAKGWGVGHFAKLKLTHLIPAERLDPGYMVRLMEGVVLSGYVLSFLWGQGVLPPERSMRRSIGVFRQRLRMTPFERDLSIAKERAEQAATAIINRIRNRKLS